MADALGQVTFYQLDLRGQTTRETDPSDAVTTFECDRYRRLLWRTDPLGRTVTNVQPLPYGEGGRRRR
ncbi:hypothetical protein [Streptomyces sp. NPDC048637]|uniref:hypothetical protein n=1 Tax=Streptomyces sp. NPDC048637 TaxID=3155636 RepID=UPI0034479B6D